MTPKIRISIVVRKYLYENLPYHNPDLFSLEFDQLSDMETWRQWYIKAKQGTA